jgi:DNA gyrase subunit B
MSNKNSGYTASSLSVLKGLEAVRKRPGMYIDSTDKVGLHHLPWEIIDNSVDESLAGHCSEIIVTINPENMPENSISIEDNGRGMPVDFHEGEGISGVELIMTKLHGGAKFDNSSYKTSGGLHGVGAAVTNALSTYLSVIVKRDGKIYKQEFSCGIPKDNIQEIGTYDGDSSGTIVSFKPDPEIFKHAMEECNLEFDFEIISKKLKLNSYLNKGLKLVIRDLKSNKHNEFLSENGIVDIVLEGIKNEEKLITPKPFYLHSEETINYDKGDPLYLDLELSCSFEKEFFSNNISTFVNNIHTKDGGTHLIGMKTAFTKVINDYAKGSLDYHEKLEIDDILEGANIALSIKLSEAQFGGQTKQTLTSKEARPFVYNSLKDELSKYFEENPEIAKGIVNKAISAKRARERLEKAKIEVRRETGMSAVGALANKLADCSSKDMEKCEIFLVEGDSAGGSAKQGRDRKYQAILPLRGKVLNSGKASESQIYQSKEIMTLRKAIGTDMGEDFDIKKLKYGKIILLMDADVDGSHIALLLLTLFSKKMIELIEHGRIYIACPPLFSARNNRSKKGHTKYYVNQEAIDKDYPEGIPDYIDIGRFKGLGEMNPDQLWATTMNPENRVLQKLILNDENKELCLSVIEDLMGDEIEPRKKFLEENAKYAEILN